VHISSWVTLWLEECVKVPETAFDVFAGWHFLKAHLEENFSKLFSKEQKGMTVATLTILPVSIEIV